MHTIKFSTLFILIMITSGCTKSKSKAVENKISVSSIVNKMTSGESSSRTQKGIPAPNFKLRNVNGDLFTFNDLKGKVVLLNFWGTWCAPCRAEIPDFVKLNNKYHARGLEIVGITLQSGEPADILRFMEKWDMNYTILTDIENHETELVTRLFGETTGKVINVVPTTFLINREGLIVKEYLGPRSEEIFFRDLEPYL
ncbi:MAG: TlpA disulfide reductase family protein [Candidatus Neomarinimicrobiota bacterium]